MKSKIRTAREGLPAAVTLLLSGLVAASLASADPPAAAPAPAANAPTGEVTVAESKGGFLASLRQSIEEDPKRDVVRGHFDVGTPGDMHRFYCLVSIKSGKNEENGVRGTPYVRADGMTGLKEPAVSPLSCADAERQGLLVTTGYVLTGKLANTAPAGAPPVAATAAPVAPAATSAAPAAAAAVPAAAATAAAVSAPAAAAPAASGAAPAAATPAAAAPIVAAATPADPAVQSEVMALFQRFVSAQNAHDRAGVAATLLDSPDFSWAQYRGNTLWGYREAMDEFVQDWKQVWKLEPQLREARVGSLAAGTAVLVTPLLFTQGIPGQDPVTVPIRWGGVFVKTKGGWRIASIFITPFKDWHTPNG